ALGMVAGPAPMHVQAIVFTERCHEDPLQLMVGGLRWRRTALHGGSDMNVVIGALGWKSFYRIGFIVDAVALQTLDGTRERAASFPGVHRSDLDVPLLPLRETHAVFQFFDGAGEPLSELTAR